MSNTNFTDCDVINMNHLGWITFSAVAITSMAGKKIIYIYIRGPHFATTFDFHLATFPASGFEKTRKTMFSKME